MTPGDLVLLAFPQTDLEPGKLRPALVIAIAPGRHDDALLALVSSRVHQAVAEFDELISPGDPDFADSRLKSESIVRLGRLATVDRQLIRARLGAIGDDRFARIRQRLIGWIQG